MFSQKKIHARRSFDIFVGFVCLAVATAGMVRGLVKAFVVTKFTQRLVKPFFKRKFFAKQEKPSKNVSTAQLDSGLR